MHQPQESALPTPFIVHREVEINAQLDLVWDLQVRVSEWPSWHPAIDATTISAASINDRMGPGTQFRWTTWQRDATTVTVDTVVPRQRLVWRTVGDGLWGVHEWQFERTPRGTLVIVTELLEYTGRLDVTLPSDAATDQFLSLWLHHLKAEAEARS